ncbi:hypothetical protein BKA82DRAFT_2966586 [Pisolithus tinctorius]|nr:hypothetical protein BKA82DRAFT_2966586 [Pisolithus tinctorius]
MNAVPAVALSCSIHVCYSALPFATDRGTLKILYDDLRNLIPGTFPSSYLRFLDMVSSKPNSVELTQPYICTIRNQPRCYLYQCQLRDGILVNACYDSLPSIGLEKYHPQPLSRHTRTFIFKPILSGEGRLGTETIADEKTEIPMLARCDDLPGHRFCRYTRALNRGPFRVYSH